MHWHLSVLCLWERGCLAGQQVKALICQLGTPHFGYQWPLISPCRSSVMSSFSWAWRAYLKVYCFCPRRSLTLVDKSWRLAWVSLARFLTPWLYRGIPLETFACLQLCAVPPPFRLAPFRNLPIACEPQTTQPVTSAANSTKFLPSCGKSLSLKTPWSNLELLRTFGEKISLVVWLHLSRDCYQVVSASGICTRNLKESKCCSHSLRLELWNPCSNQPPRVALNRHFR